MDSTNKTTATSIIIIVLLLIGVGAYVYSQDKQTKPEIPDQTSSTASLVNDGTNAPIITSINPTSTDHSGTSLTIKGSYLNGFEGGTAVWFENESGAAGVIEARSYAPEGGTTVTFTLPSQLCIQNMGESGLPCPAYMNMKPGSYKVFVRPWGIQSNKLPFTIQQ